MGQSTISRRSFLAGAGVAASSLVPLVTMGCTSQSSASQSSSTTTTGDAWIAKASADETVDADFVIIGAGMAGLSAAIKAAQDGLNKVVLLEKNATLGGNSLFAEGIFGNGDRFQLAAGYGPYDTESMLEEEISWSHGISDASLFRPYFADAAEYINWLEDLGVTFANVTAPGNNIYALHIYDGGNGASAVKVLENAATNDYGVDIRKSTPATALLFDGDKVVGAQATAENGSVINFKAPTTCIATGGMGSNDELMDEYTRLDPGKYRYIGNKGQDGDGMKLAETTAHGRGRHLCPENMWLGVVGCGHVSNVNMVAGPEGTNMWFNQTGNRFIDESQVQDFFTCNNIILNQGQTFSLFDQGHVDFFKNYGTTCFWSGFSTVGKPIASIQDDLDKADKDDSIELYKCDTLDEVAETWGVDKDTLKKTVDAYNAGVASGADEFGKATTFLAKIATPPFYTAKFENLILTTMGGIRVNGQGQVTAPDATPVEGLYAAGVCVNGFAGEVYSTAAPGTNQGPAVWMGRMIADTAAERA